ncbi:MAG TPA: hypothetical protein VGM54_06945 [Chthoniobacter sp.]|jgi:hypothetical protein
MKTLFLTLLAAGFVALASGCASHTTIGTTHHHVTLGGDIH